MLTGLHEWLQVAIAFCQDTFYANYVAKKNKNFGGDVVFPLNRSHKEAQEVVDFCLPAAAAWVCCVY